MSEANYFLGLDFGTTSLSAVLYDNTLDVVKKAISKSHEAYIDFADPWRKEQDLKRLEICLFEVLDQLLPQKDMTLGGIGLTGQMHGIVGLNSNGIAVTNLVTWQDDSGNQVLRNGQSLLEEIEQLAPGQGLSAGYGLVTLYAWLVQEVHEEITTFCSVADYFAMLLTDNRENLIDASMAQSVGGFDRLNNDWEPDSIKKLNLSKIAFPKIADRGPIVGTVTHPFFTERSPDSEIPVSVAIGDNQASFIGSADIADGSMLINIGTATQISVALPTSAMDSLKHLEKSQEIEFRPLVPGKCLFSVNLISGGAVYHSLFHFFRKCGVELFGMDSAAATSELWERMQTAGEKGSEEKEALRVSPLFDGTRNSPMTRGMIENINLQNLTPQNLIYSTLLGIAQTLKSAVPYEILAKVDRVVGSGNGLKKNPLLQELISKVFDNRLILSQSEEEAATGAAKWFSNYLLKSNNHDG